MKIINVKNDAAITIGIDEIPLPSIYGAAELKFFIRKNSYRAALITLLILLFMFIFNIIVDTVQSASKAQFTAPIIKITLDDLPPPDAESVDIPPPEVVINTGPAARAGNPIPVPDAMIAPDTKDFATLVDMSQASHTGGDGTDTKD
jgi:hypothetical protein